MAGFMAKFYVFLYAAQAGLVWLVAIGVVNSVISLYYYLRVVFEMYVAEGDPESSQSTRRVRRGDVGLRRGRARTRSVPRDASCRRPSTRRRRSSGGWR